MWNTGKWSASLYARPLPHYMPALFHKSEGTALMQPISSSVQGWDRAYNRFPLRLSIRAPHGSPWIVGKPSERPIVALLPRVHNLKPKASGEKLGVLSSRGHFSLQKQRAARVAPGRVMPASDAIAILRAQQQRSDINQ
eukprot:2113132-Amphidinium_carterae.1